MKRLKRVSTYSGPGLGVRAIFLSEETKRPYVNLPIIMAVEQRINNLQTFLNIQGKLATNSNGYVSFKIPQDSLQKYEDVYLYPLGNEDLKVPMLDFITRTNGEGIQTKLISCDIAATIRRENIPSIQKADLLDHEFIPFFNRASFRNSCQTFEENTMPPDTTTGGDGTGTSGGDGTGDANANGEVSTKKDCGCHDPHYTKGNEPQGLTCETLLPDTQAVECLTINQLNKDNASTADLTVLNNAAPMKVQTGEVTIYESCFEPYGYSLGDLSYSVSLAPCEVVNIAVENWFRQDRNVRSESTTKNERLENTVIQSKSVQEFIKSRLTENKFNVGLSAVLPLKIPIGVNTGYSFGSKKSTAEMVQEINETHRQLSNSYASYNSVAVYETTQTESSNVTTRTLRNHNHCHTLNLMYYEVIQNIKLTTIEEGSRPALFLQYPTPCFTIIDVLAKRHILRETLLDVALIECLDSICLEEYSCDCSGSSTSEVVDPIGDGGTQGAPCPAIVTKLTVTVRVSDNLLAGSDDSLYFVLEINGVNESFYLPHTGDSKYEKDGSYTNEITIPPTCIDNITKVGLEMKGGNEIMLSNLSITYESQEDPGTDYFFFNQGLNDLEIKRELIMLNSEIRPQYPPVAPPTDDGSTDVDASTVAKTCCENNLLQHLNCNKLYYYKIFWMAEDENQRAVRLASYVYGGQPLLDVIENMPLGVLGDWVAFPTTTPLTPAPSPTQEETFLYAPTGSLFSEAVLGQCGSCEAIDENVFWDWTGKQCSDAAPAITTGGLSQFQNPALSPFNFANSVLSQQAFNALTGTSSLAALVQVALGQAITSSTPISTEVLTELIKLLQPKKPKDESENDGDGGPDTEIDSDGDGVLDGDDLA